MLPCLSFLLKHPSCLSFHAGVLNTDNCSILGLTIDYGPYGFLDVFDPSWTPNLTDMQGRRYATVPALPCWLYYANAGRFRLSDLLPRMSSRHTAFGMRASMHEFPKGCHKW